MENQMNGANSIDKSKKAECHKKIAQFLQKAADSMKKPRRKMIMVKWLFVH